MHQRKAQSPSPETQQDRKHKKRHRRTTKNSMTRNTKFFLLFLCGVVALQVYYRKNDAIPTQQQQVNRKQPAFHSTKAVSSGTRTNITTNRHTILPPTSPPMSLVSPRDIVCKRGWDDAPILLENHKLVFFTVPKVGCTVWKQLFRRILGYTNWNATDGELIHHPNANGLKYLSDVPIQVANKIMTSKEWTKAVFVRNPQERFLSAYLDKALHNNGLYVYNHCCKSPLDKKSVAFESNPCVQNAKESLQGFYRLVHDRHCMDPHWMPQWNRMEPKYWPYINYVGSFEDVDRDAERLLKKLHLWQDYGASGWGTYGNESIFGSTKTVHATHAKELLSKHYTPSLEGKVKELYRMDYNNDVYSHLFHDNDTIRL